MPVIESMTRYALLAGGIDENKLDLLLLDALKGRKASKRRLERAIGTNLTVQLEHGDSFNGWIPIQYARDGHRRNGVISARFQLARGVIWEDDSLWCEVPDTLKIAIQGRPLSAVLEHPGIDGATPILAPQRGEALLSIKRQTKPVSSPSLPRRIRHVGTRLAMTIEDMRSDKPIPAMRKPMACVLVINAVAMVWIMLQNVRIVSWWSVAMLSTAMTISLLQFVNAMSNRPLMFLRPLFAESRHKAEMALIRKEEA